MYDELESLHLRAFKRSLATLHCGEKDDPYELLRRSIRADA